MVLAVIFVTNVLVGAGNMSRVFADHTCIAHVIEALALPPKLVITLLSRHRIRWRSSREVMHRLPRFHSAASCRKESPSGDLLRDGGGVPVMR